MSHLPPWRRPFAVVTRRRPCRSQGHFAQRGHEQSVQYSISLRLRTQLTALQALFSNFMSLHRCPLSGLLRPHRHDNSFTQKPPQVFQQAAHGLWLHRRRQRPQGGRNSPSYCVPGPAFSRTHFPTTLPSRDNHGTSQTDNATHILENYLHFIRAANYSSVLVQQEIYSHFLPFCYCTTPNAGCNGQPISSTKWATDKRQTSSLVIHCRHWYHGHGTSRVKSVGRSILYNRCVCGHGMGGAQSMVSEVAQILGTH